MTNTGPTVINGNLGVSPGSSITGIPPGSVVPPGTIHVADAVAAGAQSDNTTAYNALAGQACNFNLTGQDLGGLTLIPGVYCFSSSAQLTGTLTLNGQGNPNAVFIFQAGSTLTTASNSSVNLINGASACNVFWQIGSSATLGTTTSFAGDILALTSITLNTGATESGSLLAQNGAVTLDSNMVSITSCNATFLAPPAIVKAFGAAAIGVGGNTALVFTITNPNTAAPLTGVAFTDTLPVNLNVSTPNGLTGNCGGGAITAVAGSGSVSLTGGTLAGGASCTFSVNVFGAVMGTATNSVTVSSVNGGAGNTSSTSVAVLAAPPTIAPPTIVKTFGAAAIGVGGTTSLSFTINNPNAATSLTSLAFTDTLPAGLVVSNPNNLSGSCGGSVTAVAGTGSVSLAGGTLAGGASCTISLNVTGTGAGPLTNSVAVTSGNGGAGNTSAALLNVVPAVIAPPTISKSFGVTSILPGASATLTFTIANPNAAVAENGVAFTDTLPTGLTVAAPNGLTGSCGGGLITALAGSGSIGLSGATLAAATSCTFSVNVTSPVSGTFTNVTGNVASTNGGVGNTSLAVLLVGGEFLVGYGANLQFGDTTINMVNTGANGASLLGPGFGANVGNICVNVYGFSSDEEMIACCSCLITPDQAVNLGVNRDLTLKTLTGVVPTSVTFKLLPSLAGVNGSGASCSNSAATITTATLVSGLAAWSTTLHQSAAGAFDTTETPLVSSTLSGGELASLGGRCASIMGNGSGFGVCSSCRQGALGAAKQ